MGVRSIGSGITLTFSALPWLSGFVAAVLSLGVWFIRERIALPHAVSLAFGGTLVFGTIALVVYLRPDTLGHREINLLSYLPDKLKKIRIVSKMMSRLDGLA